MQAKKGDAATKLGDEAELEGAGFDCQDWKAH
jgi:hypothetical protein